MATVNSLSATKKRFLDVEEKHREGEIGTIQIVERISRMETCRNAVAEIFLQTAGQMRLTEEGAVGSLHCDQSKSIQVSLPTKPSTVHILRSFEPLAPGAEQAWTLPCVLITSTYGTQEFYVPVGFSFLMFFYGTCCSHAGTTACLPPPAECCNHMNQLYCVLPTFLRQVMMALRGKFTIQRT